MPALPAPTPPPLVQPRQSGSRGSVPTTYGALYSSPHPGVVAGAVLASIAGYILVVWVIYTCLNIAPAASQSDAVSTYLGGESVVTLSTVRRSRSRRPRRPVRVRERVEVRRREGSRRPPPPEIVDEPESESDVFMGGGRSGGRGGRTVSTVSDDDEIIVEEEHGRRGRRGSYYDDRSRSRRGSYYEDRRHRRRSRD
ncbi:hypothetical protein VUR80DRAFT_9553 [Thermomyces stellatus]